MHRTNALNIPLYYMAPDSTNFFKSNVVAGSNIVIYFDQYGRLVINSTGAGGGGGTTNGIKNPASGNFVANPASGNIIAKP